MPDAAGVPTGTPLSDPPLVEMIAEDPVLRGTKLIAEAWDCDGLNQVPRVASCRGACLPTLPPSPEPERGGSGVPGRQAGCERVGS